MRPLLLALVVLTGMVLAACQMALPTGPTGAGIGTDAIAVTSLDAPAAAADAATPAGPTTPRPKGRPDQPQPPEAGKPEAGKPEAGKPEAGKPGDGKPGDGKPETATPDLTAEPATPSEETEPEAPKTPEQLLCEKAKGQWANAGNSGAFFCSNPTRDAGKQCRKKTDCQGQCLARSGTCAPITPLLGCNEIFEKDGRRVTLCID